jgi:hypothetical protein
MRRRGSIARLMLTVGLSALALTLLPSWLGPANRFGFLGLMALMILVTLITGLATTGPIRRFFAGAAATGAVLWVAILIAPSTILDFCLVHLILPVDRRINLNAGQGLTRLELMSLWAELGENRLDRNGTGPAAWVLRRTWIYRGSSELQALLLIPPAFLATVGGLIAASRRPRPTLPSSPADRP